MITGPMVFVMFLACLYGLHTSIIVYRLTHLFDISDGEGDFFVALHLMAAIAAVIAITNYLAS